MQGKTLATLLLAIAMTVMLPLNALSSALQSDRPSRQEIRAAQLRQLVNDMLPMAHMWVILFDPDMHTQKERVLPQSLFSDEPIVASAKRVVTIPLTQWCASNVWGDRGPCVLRKVLVPVRAQFKFITAKTVAQR